MVSLRIQNGSSYELTAKKGNEFEDGSHFSNAVWS